MNGRKRIAAVFAALMLPLAAAAENTVEVLPTTPPMPEPVSEENEYAPENLDAYYAGFDPEDFQSPAMTAEEKARMADAQAKWDAGERPESSILDLTEQIHVSLIRLPAEHYEGQSWFLLLPCRELTDDELLQIADAFGELGIRFDPDTLSWRNCMRGGAVENNRTFRGDEADRYRAITEQYMRAAVRPETPFTAAVYDDGIGEVTMDEEDYCGLDGFRFKPARRLTDEELLQICAQLNPEPAASPNELTQYEAQLRQEMHTILGMPIAVERSGSESVDQAEDREICADERTVYWTGFIEVGGSGQIWRGELDTATGKLVSGKSEPEESLRDGNQLYSDVRMDPWDPHWAETAEKAVASLRGDGTGIDHVQSWGDERMDYTYCACVRVTMADGGVYRVYISYTLDRVVMIRYNDAVSMALEDEFNNRMLEEGNVNE